MRKKLNKISILFLAFIFLLTLSLSTVKVFAENGEEKVYETIDAYLEEQYSGVLKEDIGYLSIDCTINDYTGLSTLPNLTSLNLYNSTNIESIEFEKLSKLEELNINTCKWNGTLDLSKNTTLKSIIIGVYNLDLTNIAVNIKGLDNIRNFSFNYYNCTNYELEKNVLTDDYDVFDCYSYDDEQGGITGYADFTIYKSIEEYLQYNEPEKPKEEIVSLFIDAIIKDYTGLETLPNLTFLSIEGNTNIDKVNFAQLTKLEKVYLSDSKLSGKLDFTKNENLTEIYIELKKDISEAVVDIRGLEKLKFFSFNFSYTTGINDIKDHILMDYYEFLDYYSYEDGENTISGSAYFKIYDTIEEYLQEYYSDTPKEEITQLYIYNIVKDYTGLSTLTNLQVLNIEKNNNIHLIDFTDVPTLERVDFSECRLNGTLDFTKNTNLKNIEIQLTGDLSKAVVNIKGMDWLKDFSFKYYDATGFNLEKCILTDDYSVLEYDKYEYEDAPTEEEYSFYIEIYNNIDEYLAAYYSETNKEDITYLSIYDYVLIKDYSGLSNLSNLTSLSLYGIHNLNQVTFDKASNLESVYISDGELNGTLDFTKNNKLEYLYVGLCGDLSNAVVDIRGTSSIETFEYRHSSSTGFELEKCILMDDYSMLVYNEYDYEDTIQKSYSYNIDIYSNIKEFLLEQYSIGEEDIKNINDISIYENHIIKDYSDINSLFNLEYIYIEGQKLPGINFEGLNKLETIQLRECELNGILNLSKNTNLKEIIIDKCKLNQTLDLSKNTNLSRVNINLTGDLSSAVVNIKGLKNIEEFKYEHYNSTGFNLKTSILADNYDALERSTYENSNGHNVEAYTIVKTLTQYLIESGLDTNLDGKLSADEWKKVKNLDINGDTLKVTGIENAVNLKELLLFNVDPNLIDFSKLSNIEYLSICVENKKVDFVFPKMSKLEQLYVTGINNIDISNLSELKSIDVWEITGKIKFPAALEKLERLYLWETEIDNKLDLSKSVNLNYASLNGVKEESIVFPTNKFSNIEEDWINIRDIEKEISIKKGRTYSFYNMKPVCETNNIIEISTEDEYEYKVTGKEVGTLKVKLKDNLENEFEVTITVSDNKVDTTLENTGITSEFVNYGEYILKSNGELWEVNSETTAEKIDTNVKKYVSDVVYAKGDLQVGIENIIKKDNTLSVKVKNNTTENVASNVADVNGNLYLTTTGDLYEIGASYITEEVSPKKVLSNVKKITNDCIVLKDGTTWYQEPYNAYYTTNNVTFKKLADFEIKDSRNSYYDLDDDEYNYFITLIDLNNNLWCNEDREGYFNDSGLVKLKENFKGYKEFNNSWHFKLENGNAVYVVEEYNDETGEYEIVDSKVMLTDVHQLSDTYWGDVILRKDGSIWLYDEANGLTKITKSTVVEEDKKDEEEKEEEKKENPFTDISEKAWYYNAVKFNYERGMILGTTETTFDPNKDLTRGMLVTILWRMEKNPQVTTNQFTDVGKNVWYSSAVNWAANNKIVSGYGNGKFGPNDKITREQLAVILRNYAIYKKKDVSARTDLSKFVDNKYISSYAKDAVSWAVANKVISGKSEGTRVDPHGKATRAEAAAMLYNYCMNIK